jgi:hypothetical protein
MLAVMPSSSNEVMVDWLKEARNRKHCTPSAGSSYLPLRALLLKTLTKVLSQNRSHADMVSLGNLGSSSLY